MKQQSLFFSLACLLFSSLFFSKSQAATDITSTYLINPSFEILQKSDGSAVTAKTENLQGSSLYGWTIPDFGTTTYVNIDVESAASGTNSGFGSATASDGTYYFFNRKGWCGGIVTTTTLSTTTGNALPIGTYYLEFDYKAADHSNGSTTSNGTTMNIAVTASNDLTTLATTAIAKIAQSTTGNNTFFNTSPWQKKGIVFNVIAATKVTFTIYQNMKNSGRSDIIYDNFRLYDISDTNSENPTEISGCLANPSFEMGNGGTATRLGGTAGGGSINAPISWTLDYNASGWHDANSYTTTPAQGSVIWNIWSGTTTSLDLHQETLTLPAGLYQVSAALRTEEGKISNQRVYAISEEKTFYSDTLLAPSAYGASTWNAQDAWQTLAATFCVLKNDATIRIGASSTGGANALGWFQIDHFQLKKIGNEKEAAYTLLAKYINDANANITGYTTYDGYDTFVTAIATAQSIYDAATLDVAGVQTAINDLKRAERACMWSATLPFDATSVIANPSFEESDRFSGWSNTGFASQTNNSFAKTGTVYTEKWISSGSTLANLNMQQNLSNLPNGIYALTATASATQAGEAANGCYLFANGNQTQIGESNKYHVIASVTDGTLSIGFKTVSTTANWVAVDNFQLFYCGANNSQICSTATLTDIQTNTGNWDKAFEPDITSYHITVNMLTNLTISATAAAWGSIAGTGTIHLVSGETTTHNVTVTSINGTNSKTYQLTIYVDPTAVLSTMPTDWMGQLRCDTRLSKLSIPGTHNSAANSGGSLVKCQDKTIAEQLASGIRFLDIRLRADAGDTELELCHGSIALGTYFETAVMATVRTFLDAHPDEVIFMSIKRDDGDSDTYFSLLQAALENNSTNLPYLQQYISPTTTLGDCRGKIIPLHRQLIGWNYYGGRFINFADNTSFDSYIEVKYGSNITLKAEDYYACGTNYDNKVSAITTLLADSKNSTKNNNTWFLTYLSGTTSSILVPTPETVAKNVGPSTLSWLQTQGLGNYGIVPMDFAGSSSASGPALTTFLINCNTQYLKTDTVYYFGEITLGDTYNKNGFSVIPIETGNVIYTETRTDESGCSYIAKLTLTVKNALVTSTTAQKQQISISVFLNKLRIDNFNIAQKVEIFDVWGKCFYSQQMAIGTTEITLPAQGVYIVKTETETLKVLGM